MIGYRQENIAPAIAAIGAVPHMQALRQFLPEILEPECDNSFSKTGNAPFRAAVFNMERGHYMDETIALFRYGALLAGLDVILANELDWGMARTGNLHTTREFAKALGMNYAYGVEFLLAKAGQKGNREGFHGNAILSKFPLQRVKLIHLPVMYDWFYREGDQRLGGRIALLAEVTAKDMGRVGLVCVHLENRATPAQRKTQLAFVLEAAAAHFGDIPVLVGGDMNTNTVEGNAPGSMEYLNLHPEEQWRRLGQIPCWEPQLEYAAAQGYSYEDCNIMVKSTRRKPMPDGGSILLNLDWFFQKGLCCTNPARVESIFHCNGLREDAPEDVRRYQGRELSDHDIVLVTCGKVSP